VILPRFGDLLVSTAIGHVTNCYIRAAFRRRSAGDRNGIGISPICVRLCVVCVWLCMPRPVCMSRLAWPKDFVSCCWPPFICRPYRARVLGDTTQGSRTPLGFGHPGLWICRRFAAPDGRVLHIATNWRRAAVSHVPARPYRISRLGACTAFPDQACVPHFTTGRLHVIPGRVLAELGFYWTFHDPSSFVR
jgi:hypothetical protein